MKENGIQTAVKRVTQADVAKAAGVSKGTVDRALHNRKGIDEKVKRSVLSAAKKLGYKPNRVAQLLSMKTTKFIGIIYPEHPKFFWDQVRDGLLSAERELDGFGITTEHRRFEILTENFESEMHDLVRYFAEKPIIDALIILPSVGPTQRTLARKLLEEGITIVTLTHDFTDDEYSTFHIGVDLRQGGKVAADLMGKFLKGKGRVLGLKDYPTVRSLRRTSIIRFENFQEHLNTNFPGITLVPYEFKKVLSEGERRELAALLSNPSTGGAGHWDGVYISEGEFLGEVGEIIKDAIPEERPIVIGHEINDTVGALLKEEAITATVCQQPYMEGYYAIKILHEYLVNKNKPVQDYMYTNLEIITKENYDNHDTFVRYFKLFAQ